MENKRVDFKNLLDDSIKGSQRCLTVLEMKELAERGLCNFEERQTNHIIFGYSVEDLMLLLPDEIIVDDKIYYFNIYKTAFGIPAVRYIDYNEHKDLFAIAVNDITEGTLLSTLHRAILKIDDEYSDTLAELKQFIKDWKINMPVDTKKRKRR